MKAKYIKENFEPIVKSSKNYTEILQKMELGIKGNSRTILKKYIKLYKIDISHFDYSKKGINNAKNTIPLEKILVSGSTYTNVGNIKNRLYQSGLKERKCEKCGQDENWHGEHMSLILDHIDGVPNNNKIENLRIVCPNCNATLPTFAGKNVRKKSIL